MWFLMTYGFGMWAVIIKKAATEICSSHYTGTSSSAVQVKAIENKMDERQNSARFTSYLRRAGRAASYPLRGIGYFARTPEFWPLFLGRLFPLSMISLIVYFILFVFAFPIQFAFLAIFHGWSAWLSAVVLVLGEGLVIIQGLFEGFFVDECRVDVYDVCTALSPSLSL